MNKDDIRAALFAMLTVLVIIGLGYRVYYTYYGASHQQMAAAGKTIIPK